MLGRAVLAPPDLAPLLSPRSVAVIGASERPGNLGGVAIRLLQRFGFEGTILPVNPGVASVSGCPALASPAMLAEPPDVALFSVSAERLPAAVRDAAAAGIRHGIAWAGGFTEAGAPGSARQAELAGICRETGFLLCGPNCLGIINTATRFTGTFTSSLSDRQTLLGGSIAIVSQSGGLAAQAMGLANREGFGFRYLVSCGNEAVLTAADFIRAFAADEQTGVIAAYLESVADGPAFVAALQDAKRCGKPVVVLKGGGTEESGRAVLAHTGRLGGSDRAFDAVLRECAAIRVRSLEELVDTVLLAESFRGRPATRGTRVAVTTFGGGAGVLAVDQCAQSGLRVSALDEGTRARMSPLVTPLASLGNPVDLTPQSINEDQWRSRLGEALACLADDDEVDAILFLAASMPNRVAQLVGLMSDLRERSPKPIVASWSLASSEATSALRDAGFYNMPEPARAARALGHLCRSQDLASRPGDTVAPRPPAVTVDDLRERPGEVAVIGEHRVADILREVGLGVAPGRLATNPSDAVDAAVACGFPVALKGASPQVPHRASAGLVRLGVQDPAGAVLAFEVLESRARELGVEFEGVYIQAMVLGGSELIISASRDDTFGTMVTVGAGGNLTELIDDVAMGRAPLGPETARAMLGRLRSAHGLEQAHGPGVIEHAATYLAAFSQLAAVLPWRGFTLELNPVKVDDARAVAVDGLLIIDAP